MGGVAYFYNVEFQEDYNAALQELRNREFEAGRYNPVIMFPSDEPEAMPGKQHSTIDEAMEASMEDGTRSILDLSAVGTVDEYCVARILNQEELIKYFGTTEPTMEIIDKSNLFENIERGKGVCVPVYKDGRLMELFFAGYSFD